MKRNLLAAAIGILMGASIAGPTNAGQSDVSVFLFGRIYNDGVTAISVSEGRSEDERHPSYYLIPVRMRIAQQIVMGDPSLLDALERRQIAVHNVLWVQTAANGGKVIYYR